jgi:N-acetylneuraminic acid mutarotase
MKMKTQKNTHRQERNFNWILAGFALSALLGAASMNANGAEIWTEKAPMPTARLGLTASVVNGKIYAIGGYAAANSPGMRTVEEYDPTTDTWTTKAPMPTGRRWLSSSVVNGKIYAIGGYTNFGAPGLAAVEMYDPTTDTWATKAPMPSARLGLSSCVVNGIIYAIGGASIVPQSLRTVEAYDPLTDTWTRKADMPTRTRFFLCASAAGGKIYAIGGGGSSRSVTFSTVEEYDPAMDTWTEKADLPGARSALSTCVIDGRIYAIGGDSGSQILPNVEEYDPVKDTWTQKAEMPEPKGGLGSGTVNGKIYVIGGMKTAGGGHPGVRTMYEYDPAFIVTDFNGNGTVDTKDLLKLIEAWGQDDPSLDIGPTPLGDGMIDAADLEVLMSHWGQEVDDPTLRACWKLDETDGDVAYDSAAVNDAIVMGGAQWQPDAGRGSGALQFGGIEDYIKTPFKLNPADGEFSVFAWIKGGTPGQVILSQENGVNWLMADPELSTLRTDVSDPVTQSRRGSVGGEPLVSQTVIADGNWHRVGLVWD